jgi:predicted small secreted protein
MSEYIYLIGAEDVRSAGSSISLAAQDIRRAANSISESVYSLQQIMDNFLIRLEEITDDKNNKT